MKLGLYVINLDSSIERWRAIRAKADQYGMPMMRVAAVDGRQLSQREYGDVDWKGFLRHGGRLILAGEYGCYRSHIKCLSMLVESDFDAAIVMEDDVEVTADLIERTTSIIDAVRNADVVKLFNHRCRGFRHMATSALGDEIGRCLHGPQGSAACYVITRLGAEKMLSALQHMAFPFDVALERGWHHGSNVLTAKRNLVSLMTHSRESLIGHRADYRRVKFFGPKRLPTHVLRVVEYWRRVRYALEL
ncbi:MULTISPECIES: glycosyltransferase family 25 protein [Rhizobium]|uniref:Glycosyl transferase family 25 n=1 Tax=Rhizobium paranaense TaxID=1650438 RepID=A0A7W8XUV6_9HYPH|nr:glycosyltransferase family 25 protein [Rhizobium paranaense]MBB5575951.1 glycosyl transferase family 25 [Rhizobium paranaense]